MKTFNTTGVCIPSKHYMVDLSERVSEIRKVVDDGKYFVINRARQYGKTTTLTALERALGDAYYAILMDFQDYSKETFQSEDSFCRDFSSDFCAKLEEKITAEVPELTEAIRSMESLADDTGKPIRLFTMFRSLRRIWDSSDKPVVLIVDEADSAANNQLFIDFLASLRSHYIKRQKNLDYRTFQSVILAGVTDVRHLKSKIRDEDQHRLNSPWNIAADFNIDMSLSVAGIQGMLDEYEADHGTGMDTAAIAKQIREYTNGYPFLVSRICQIIDTELVPARFDTRKEAWTAYGADEAVRLLLSETDNTLFESLTGKLTNYPALRKQLRNILHRGEVYAWLPYDEAQQQLRMYGFSRNDHNTVAIANRVFEMLLYAQFIGEGSQNERIKQAAAAEKQIFIDEDGTLNMPRIMEHFIAEYRRIHKSSDDEEREIRFVEEEGRERFLTYLSPIINGTGTWSVEEQTRDGRRMDAVIHYLGRRYVIELKIWRGLRYNAEGEKQISEYLDYFGLDTGYMLSFNFNRNKNPGVQQIYIGNKLLYEGTV